MQSTCKIKRFAYIRQRFPRKTNDEMNHQGYAGSLRGNGHTFNSRSIKRLANAVAQGSIVSRFARHRQRRNPALHQRDRFIIQPVGPQTIRELETKIKAHKKRQ